MPMSRFALRFWLGSSTSPPLMTRSNLSFGPIAANAGPLASAAAVLPRKSRRDKRMTPSPNMPVLARFMRRLALTRRARFHTRLIVAAFAACVAGGSASAQYPERPIRLIVPFPAGGTVDLVARLVTARMADDLKTSFVIENRGGGRGVIATDATAKAAPRPEEPTPELQS